jgi:hypothetical protein
MYTFNRSIASDETLISLSIDMVTMFNIVEDRSTMYLNLSNSWDYNRRSELSGIYYKLIFSHNITTLSPYSDNYYGLPYGSSNIYLFYNSPTSIVAGKIYTLYYIWNGVNEKTYLTWEY